MKKTVVVFSPGIAESGGAARRSGLIVTSLAARGWNVRVVTRAGTASRFHFRRSQTLKVLEVPGFQRPKLGGIVFLTIAIPLGLVWGWRSSAFLAIQLTSQSTAAAVCSLLTRRPYLAMSTAIGPLSEVGYVLGARTSALRQRLLRRAAFLIAQTPSGADELSRLSRRDRVRVVPNPVVIHEPFPVDGRPNVLYAGRLSVEKDLDLLLEAWSIIAERDPDAHLTLAGSGGIYRSVESALRSKVDDEPRLSRSVRFTGWVEDIAAYLRESDVFVLPSRTEGMSNSLIEACVSDRVVVVSDIPGNRAVVGDSYILRFRCGDRDDLVRVLEAAMYDGTARDHARHQIRTTVSQFSVDSVMDRLEILLGDAADSPRS